MFTRVSSDNQTGTDSELEDQPDVIGGPANQNRALKDQSDESFKGPIASKDQSERTNQTSRPYI